MEFSQNVSYMNDLLSEYQQYQEMFKGIAESFRAAPSQDVLALARWRGMDETEPTEAENNKSAHFIERSKSHGKKSAP